MSDEQRKDEEAEAEVEAHRRHIGMNAEPSEEDESDDEVEAHVRRGNG
jgi:hypothetical protein